MNGAAVFAQHGDGYAAHIRQDFAATCLAAVDVLLLQPEPYRVYQMSAGIKRILVVTLMIRLLAANLHRLEPGLCLGNYLHGDR